LIERPVEKRIGSAPIPPGSEYNIDGRLAESNFNPRKHFPDRVVIVLPVLVSGIFAG
jgi:hypothetical protein